MRFLWYNQARVRGGSSLFLEGMADMDLIMQPTTDLDEFESTSSSQEAAQRTYTSESNALCEPLGIKTASSNRDGLYAGLVEQLKTLTENAPQLAEHGPSILAKKSKYKNLDSMFLRIKERQSLDVGEKDEEYGWFSEGANHKRGFSEVDFDDLKELRVSHLESNTTPQLSWYDRVRVEEYLDAVYERSTNQLPEAHDAQSEVGHEASTMLGRSPGRKRKHHSTTQGPPQATAEEEKSSPTLDGDELEIADSQDAFVGLFI
jgi:hypothetical protein